MTKKIITVLLVVIFGIVPMINNIISGSFSTKSMFDTLDFNQDNKIEHYEIDYAINIIFNESDYNQNLKLDYIEFCSVYKHYANRRSYRGSKLSSMKIYWSIGCKEDIEEKVTFYIPEFSLKKRSRFATNPIPYRKKVFRYFDRNDDDVLEQWEMQYVFKKRMRRFDSNKDEILELDELRKEIIVTYKGILFLNGVIPPYKD